MSLLITFLKLAINTSSIQTLHRPQTPCSTQIRSLNQTPLVRQNAQKESPLNVTEKSIERYSTSQPTAGSSQNTNYYQPAFQYETQQDSFNNYASRDYSQRTSMGGLFSSGVVQWSSNKKEYHDESSPPTAAELAYCQMRREIDEENQAERFRLEERTYLDSFNNPFNFMYATRKTIT